MGGSNMTPWEQPRVKRILELFGGHVVAIKQLTVRRTTDGEKEIRG